MDETLLNILGDRLGDKIQQANTYYLKKIGEAIKKIRNLTPTQAHQLVQILKYGGNYEEILMEISSLTGIDPFEIDKIFAQYSRNDLNFAKNFYEYKNIPYVPFDQNIVLKRQTEALANLTKNAMNNFTRSRALGYSIKDLDGTTKFYGLRETYEKVLDEAVLNVGQGKDTFDSSVSRILKELGESGLRTLDYASGRSIRLDSMVRMHLKSGLRELHNENQRLFGEEFGADGVEISVHEYPAEDHQDVQGRQFSYDEFNNIQTNGIGKDYKGKTISIKSGKDLIFHRPISEYNCYHYTFSIILGVSKPRYSEEELQQIIDRNKKGFEYEGKHYTMYEGTQLQRGIEREIRKQKDIQIVAKASDNTNLVYESQQKITQLTNKYRELSKVSGLKTKMERAKVSGYKRTKVDIPKLEKPNIEIPSNEVFISRERQLERIKYRREYINEQLLEKQKRLNNIPENSTRNWDVSYRKTLQSDINKYNRQLETLDKIPIEDKTIKLDTKEDCKELLKEININLKDKDLDKIDTDVVIATSKKYYSLTEKYPFLDQSLQEEHLNIGFESLEGGVIGNAERGGRNIGLDIDNFRDKEDVLYWAEYQSKDHYNMPCSKENYINYFQTHEMGHIFNYRVVDNVEISE